MGRADIPLKSITFYLLAVYFAWFVLSIVISSLSDQSGLFPGSSPLGNVNGAQGVLSTISQNHFLHYAAEGVITFFVVFGCWLAAYHQTRQLRALALVATTWGVFSWFIYIRWTLQALSNSRSCGSAGETSGRWCDVQLASGILSVLFEFGKVLLWGWATFRFVQLRNVEPFCELDKSEIEFEQRKQAGLVPNNANLPPIAGSNVPSAVQMQNLNNPTPVHVQSTPAGLMESDAPMSTAGKRITSFDQQRLGLPSVLVLFFVGLTIIGYIITVLPFIQLGRQDYQDDAVAPRSGIFGDNALSFNLFFLALTLLFSLSFAAMSAYDRLRDNTMSPLFLNLITAMQLWGLVIYSLRRADNLPFDASSNLSWDSQVAQAAGFGIMAFSETLRLGAMTWKLMTCAPAVHPHKPEISNHVGSILYWTTQALMLLTALTWMVVMIVLSASSEIFDPAATYATGLGSYQDSLYFAYHNYLISLMIMAIMFSGNMYINLAGTRTAVMSAYVGQLFCIGIWWLLCWPIAYSQFANGGAVGEAFCGVGKTSSICRLVESIGVLGMVMFGAFVANTLVSLFRLILVDFAARSALPTSELARQGTTVTRREALARGTVGFGDTWISAETFLWLAIAGWLIYAFGSTEFNTNAYFVGQNGLRDALAYELFQFRAVHFLSVAGLLCMFIQSHITTNKTYRDHSHAWRYAQFGAFFFQFCYSIPMIVLMARYVDFYSLTDSHLAAFAGLCIFTGAQAIQATQFFIYSIIYPAEPVTVMMPVSSAVAYDKAGNPMVNAVPIDVEKGETLNPHHDQAGLGTNYTKTDMRHQDPAALAAAAREKDSMTRDPHLRHESSAEIAGAERNTAINHPQYNYGQSAAV